MYLDATCLHGRLGQNMHVVSRAIAVAIGNRWAEAQGLQTLGYRDVLGIAVGDSEAESFCRRYLGSL